MISASGNRLFCLLEVVDIMPRSSQKSIVRHRDEIGPMTVNRRCPCTANRTVPTPTIAEAGVRPTFLVRHARAARQEFDAIGGPGHGLVLGIPGASRHHFFSCSGEFFSNSAMSFLKSARLRRGSRADSIRNSF